VQPVLSEIEASHYVHRSVILLKLFFINYFEKKNRKPTDKGIPLFGPMLEEK